MSKDKGKHHSGSYYVKQAEKNGLRVERGKGSHVKVIGPAGRGYMVVPEHKELSTGTENAIKKWFLSLGIIVALTLACISTYLLGMFR